MSDDLRRRLTLADGVLERVAVLPVDVVELVAEALLLARGPLAGVGASFASLAGGSPALARLQFAYALRGLARDEPLALRLVEAESEPWRSLGAALRVVGDAELEAITAG